jgi:hypothetical protein
MVKKMVFYVVAMIAFLPLLLIVNEGDSILPNVIGISYLAIWVCIFNSPLGEALYNFYNNLFNDGRND